MVGRKVAAEPGFDYSPALLAYGKDGGTWSAVRLDRFLSAPREAAPGTRMGFPGVKDAQDRADLIAYLQTLK